MKEGIAELDSWRLGTVGMCVMGRALESVSEVLSSIISVDHIRVISC